MLCENCRARPAVVFFKQQSGEARESTLGLCNHCASDMNLEPGVLPSGSLESLFAQMTGPRARRENILAQLSELAQQVLEHAARLTLEWGYERIRIEHLLLALIHKVPDIRVALEMEGTDVAEYEARLEHSMERRAPRRAEGVGLSSGMKRVLQLSRLQAAQMGHTFIGPEHLLLAIMAEGESFAAQFLSDIDADELRQLLKAPAVPAASASGRGTEALPPNLTRFTRDLTALAKAGELDPIIGREKEIARCIRILSRKTKNNPVLIGEPGVGKTAIAEGLAQRIVSGEVPDVLKDKKVLSLDLASVIGGSKFRGEFEERFKGLMEEIRALKGKVILFIDEVHTLVGAGAGEGSMDAANMLKPSLARGELQCLGATTLDEHRKHIEKDASLERRFQPVMVAEPTPEQAIEILRGLRDSYEAHHRVKITDAALTAAVELSDKYISDRFLPDKAIDLLDEAAAMVRLGSHTEPGRMKVLEERLAQKEKDKEAAVAGERYEEASRLKGQLEALRAEVDGLRTQWQQARGLAEPIVPPEAIATVVSEWTGIPAKKLQQEESQRLLEMEQSLRQRVVGQEEALRAISEAVRRARAGLKDPGRPIGSFIFLGPTGVGKTETARALADYLFNDESAMLRFDMSEYMERHTVSRLVGAPPGYVGYEEAGRLTESVRRRPYSVLLFDEIEKAHPDVFNLLLQLLDDGRLTDSHGRTVDFKNTVIIMTSNLGAEQLGLRKGALGFQRPSEGGVNLEDERVAATVMDALRQHFRPEFLNRIDEIIVFHALDREQLNRIVDAMLASTRRKLHGQNILLEVRESAKDELARRGFDPKYGARPLRRVIQRELETELSRMLLRGAVHEGDRVLVDFAEGRFTFGVERRAVGQAAPVH
ncbi:ATP-dependent Clp protease ATP-binding subunit ClpC [Archangium gephyra]|uniref:ATP-dependent Clp protease ATP-binding subunit ClpC n=1 Tax=Archangium gephyra TaxID=48 RepID=A0AAC8QIM5_9BACT|nr:ClpB protein [Archangium gephyra]REG29874.1 ATP-dependent Clp protease ATP-binding subunit ClpC [Archangium gephyra]